MGLLLLFLVTCHAEYLLKYTYYVSEETGITGEREFQSLGEALRFVNVKRTTPKDTFKLSVVGAAADDMRQPMPSGKRHVIPLEQKE